MTFDEDAAFSESRKRHTYQDIDEEPGAPRVIETVAEECSILDGYTPEDHDVAEPRRPVDPPREMITYKRTSA